MADTYLTLATTDLGRNMIIRTLYGGSIDFTKIKIGNGAPADPYHPEEMTDLVNPLVEFGLITAEPGEGGDYLKLTGYISSADISSGFYGTEMGVYAEDADGDEYLYAYRYSATDADYYPDDASGRALELTVTLIVQLGNAENVTATLIEGDTYALKTDFDAHVADSENPHGVTAAQIGLGDVPNVTTNDQTPTYTVPTSLTDLVSGERLGTAFGKIARAISGLISHLGNTDNPHSVTASQVGAAAAGHSHSTASITSGILSVNRGGTGVSSLKSLWSSLWSGQNATLDNNKALYAKKSSGSQTVPLVKMNGNVVQFGPTETENSGNATQIRSGAGVSLRAYDNDREKTGFYCNLSVHGNLYPNSDDSGKATGFQNIGIASNRWNTLYCVNTNESSDRKLKDGIGEIDEAKDLIMGLCPVEYTFKSDKERRPRYGFIAQDVYTLMKSLGVKNAAVYSAGFTEYSDDEPIPHDNLPDSEIDQIDDSALSWGLDYIQLIAPMVKVIQEQEQRIERLENKRKEEG